MAKVSGNAGTTTTPSLDELLGRANHSESSDLKQVILHCGNLCQATYDAFIDSDISARLGKCRYRMETFFQDVILQNASWYQVESFLYAPSGYGGSVESNWIGYVAFTTDEYSRKIRRREVYVVWRGTGLNTEWITNIVGAFSVVPPTGLITGSTLGEVHSGWHKMYTTNSPRTPSAQNQLRDSIKRLKKKYEHDNFEFMVFVTGHSLGGALSTLSAFDLAQNGVVGNTTYVIAVVFGCPHVGNEAFKKRVEALSRLKIIHVRNKGDPVPNLPNDLPIIGDIFNSITSSKYVAIQTKEIVVDTDLSQSLKSALAKSEVEKKRRAFAEDGEMIKFGKSLMNLSLNDRQNFPNILSGDDNKSQAMARSFGQNVDLALTFKKNYNKLFLDLVQELAGNFHNLEATLHAFAYWKDNAFDFKLTVDRPLALVNKASGFLKDELKVPEFWWVARNKGMEYRGQKWVLDP